MIQEANTSSEPKTSSTRVRNLLVFAGCALAWLVLDLASKATCEAAGLGSTLVANVVGLFRVHVVHNYGAAWNMFEGNVVPLALFAIVVCGVLLAFAVHEAKNASIAEMVALALVFAGGFGNMLDRIVRGYVVDMIDPLFIDFPTFNIADIGVTCGIVLLVVCLVFSVQSATDDSVPSGCESEQSGSVRPESVQSGSVRPESTQSGVVRFMASRSSSSKED